MQCSDGAAAAFGNLLQIALDQRLSAPARKQQNNFPSKQHVTILRHVKCDCAVIKRAWKDFGYKVRRFLTAFTPGFSSK